MRIGSLNLQRFSFDSYTSKPSRTTNFPLTYIPGQRTTHNKCEFGEGFFYTRQAQNDPVPEIALAMARFKHIFNVAFKCLIQSWIITSSMFWDNDTVPSILNSAGMPVCPYTAMAGDVWSNSPGLNHGEAVSEMPRYQASPKCLEPLERVKVHKSDTIYRNSLAPQPLD